MIKKSSSNSEESSYKEDYVSCNGQSDYYWTFYKMNRLFVLTKEENLLLDLINKINDAIEKSEMLENCLHFSKYSCSQWSSK